MKMSRIIGLIIIVAALITVMLIGCNSMPGNVTNQDFSDNLIAGAGTPGNDTPRDFSGIIGKEWKLIRVLVNGVNTGFAGSTMQGSGGREIFTLNFDAEFVSGTGAPNQYSAPYTLTGNQDMVVGLMRSTLMASILEPAGLREHDFFTYMQNVYRWTLVNNNLQLSSKTADAGEVVLIFSL